MYKYKKEIINGKEYLHDWFQCDYCGSEIMFKDMINVEVRAQNNFKTVRKEFHSGCCMNLTLKEILEGIK